MVAFVDVPNLCRLVRRRGLGPIMQTLAEYLDEDFGRWCSFDLQARVAVHSPSGVVELMPINDGCSYAFKYVNGHPGNPEQRLQTVTAFGALADMATGYPVLICEMTVLTAIRTAATSAWAATKLARPHAENMAMIGLGAQAEFQAVAFQALLGIRKLQVHDVDAAATAKFVGNLARIADRDCGRRWCRVRRGGLRHHHHLHRRQGQCAGPALGHDRSRCAHQRDRR